MPAAAIARRVSDWLVHWERGRSPELTRGFDESWKRRAEFYAAVDKMLTTEQRAHLTHRLQDFIDDFRQLSARTAAAAQTDWARMAAARTTDPH
jgi:hypothetical protein